MLTIQLSQGAMLASPHLCCSHVNIQLSMYYGLNWPMELLGFEPRSSIFIPVICPLWKWINLNLFHYSEYRNLKEVIQSSQLIVYQLTYNSKQESLSAFKITTLLSYANNYAHYVAINLYCNFYFIKPKRRFHFMK